MYRLIPAIIILASTLLTATVVAENDVSDSTLLQSFPRLTDEESKQVLFSSSLPENMSPKGVHFEAHNPFRNKTIAALILVITFTKSPETTPTVLELLVRVNCGPLQSASGHQAFFDADEAMKVGATIKLKEVYCIPEVLALSQ